MLHFLRRFNLCVLAAILGVSVLTGVHPATSAAQSVTMPRPETTGLPAGTALTSVPPSSIQPGGTYAGVHVTGSLDIGRGAPINMSDCVIDGSVTTYAELHLTRCTVNGGIYPYEVPGSLTRVFVNSRGGQAFRPSINDYLGSGNKFPSMPWTVTDTYLKIPAGRSPQHVEASQVLGGSGYTFRNTVFDTGCPFNNTQTADLSLHATNSLIADSWFIGCGGFAIYSDGANVRFVNPRFGNRHQFGKLYRNDDPNRVYPTIVNPMDLNGSPIQIAGAQTGAGGPAPTAPAHSEPPPPPVPPPAPTPAPTAPPAPAPPPPATTTTMESVIEPVPADEESDVVTTSTAVAEPQDGRPIDGAVLVARQAAAADEAALQAPSSRSDAEPLPVRPASVVVVALCALAVWGGWTWRSSRRAARSISAPIAYGGELLEARGSHVADASVIPGSWRYSMRSK